MIPCLWATPSSNAARASAAEKPPNRRHHRPHWPLRGELCPLSHRPSTTIALAVERAERDDFEDLRENGGAGDTVVRSRHNGDCESEVRHNDRPTNLWPG